MKLLIHSQTSVAPLEFMNGYAISSCTLLAFNLLSMLEFMLIHINTRGPETLEETEAILDIAFTAAAVCIYNRWYSFLRHGSYSYMIECQVFYFVLVQNSMETSLCLSSRLRHLSVTDVRSQVHFSKINKLVDDLPNSLDYNVMVVIRNVFRVIWLMWRYSIVRIQLSWRLIIAAAGYEMSLHHPI